MKICLCTISYREKLLEVALDAAARMGFESVELWGREPHVPEVYDESRVKAIRGMLEERGLVARVLGSYLYLGRTNPKDDTVNLADTLHTAHGLRLPLVRVWASDVGSAKATEEIWEQTISEAQLACDRAAKMNVTFVVEMHDDTLADTAQSALRLMQAVDRENFKLNFQISTTSGEDHLQRLEAVLPYVAHVHCQNFVPHGHDEARRYVRVPLQAGEAKYEVLVGRLREAGYEGLLAIEFAADEGEQKENSLRHDREFLAGLIGQAG